jgi:hypothetical protein
MFDVHHDQLLVLLFVVEAELHERAEGLGQAAVEEVGHGLVGALAVGGHLGHPWPSDVAAPRAAVAGAQRLVVGVEQIGVGGVEDLVTRGERPQDERFEEPGGVAAVPLGRGDVGHRLHGLVLRGERAGELFGEGPHVAIARRPHRTERDTA